VFAHANEREWSDSKNFAVRCGQKPGQQTRRSDVSVILTFAGWYLKASAIRERKRYYRGAASG
jgi:hypothetical protein